MAEYAHEQPGTEVRFIAGYYTIDEEDTMIHKGRELLYVVGIAVVDNACCGAGGCRFLRVPGYILSWKRGVNDDGLPVSDVEPILTDEAQQEIRALLDEKFPHSQIIF